MEVPNDFGNLLASKEIDKVVVPSQMASDIYERVSPELKPKLAIWYAGVNEAFFQPQGNSKAGKNVLVYWKNAPKMLGVQAERDFRTAGLYC